MPLARLKLSHDREAFREDDEDEEKVDDVHRQSDVEGREDRSSEANEERAKDWTERDAAVEESADDGKDSGARTGVGAIGEVGVGRCCGGAEEELSGEQRGREGTHDMPPRRPSKAGPTMRKR